MHENINSLRKAIKKFAGGLPKMNVGVIGGSGVGKISFLKFLK